MLRYEKPHDLDDPDTTRYHREIILQKRFLKRIYEDWYSTFTKNAINYPNGKFVEIGSGGGFLKDVFPEVITSDILELDCCEMVFSAEKMPFEDKSLDMIMMVNVFHHIPHSRLFLDEAYRTLRENGKVVMVEPANTLFSRFIYRNFHHEPFEPTGDWEIESSGPLSGANIALPWIVFERDKAKFRSLYPDFEIKKITYHTPLRYLISGGVSMRALVPNWSYGFFTFLETLMSPLSRMLGMFVTIELIIPKSLANNDQ